MFTLRAQHFRIFERIDWTPEGVCLLAGSNGAGKSTVLAALSFLRGLLLYGHEMAFNWVSGAYFRQMDALAEEPVMFEIEVAGVRWVLRFPMSNTALRGQFGEELYRDGELVLRAAMFDEGWFLGNQRMRIDNRRCCAKVLWDRDESPWMAPLNDLMANMRVQSVYRLDLMRKREAVGGTDTYLHHTGRNLWSVLANWRAAPTIHGGKFEWVVEHARNAFPGLLKSIEFDRGLPFIFGPSARDANDALPPERAADGLLVGLAHLTAIAGAQRGAFVAFDEIESQLHPHAIHHIVDAIRKRAEECELCVVMTTHSPAVMNLFKGHEDQFFVVSPTHSGSTQIQALNELHDDAWLAHFVLGDLYEHSRFGGPVQKEQLV